MAAEVDDVADGAGRYPERQDGEEGAQEAGREAGQVGRPAADRDAEHDEDQDGQGDQRRPDPGEYSGGSGYRQREQRDDAGDRRVVAQAGDAVRDRRGDRPDDDGRGHGRGERPRRGAARRKAMADAEPAARLGISTLRTTNQGDSAWASAGPGRDDVRHGRGDARTAPPRPRRPR